jgi:hypothetical protein
MISERPSGIWRARTKGYQSMARAIHWDGKMLEHELHSEGLGLPFVSGLLGH